MCTTCTSVWEEIVVLRWCTRPLLAMYWCPSWLLSKHCTTILLIIQRVLFLFSLISSPKKTCKPVIIERYHVILFCTRVGPCSFDFYLLYLDFFSILSLSIWFHLIFISNLILIIMTINCFRSFYYNFFNFTSRHLI
jgi:hypothetical protein